MIGLLLPHELHDLRLMTEKAAMRGEHADARVLGELLDAYEKAQKHEAEVEELEAQKQEAEDIASDTEDEHTRLVNDVEFAIHKLEKLLKDPPREDDVWVKKLEPIVAGLRGAL